LVAVAGALLSSALAPATKTVYNRIWDKFGLFADSLHQIKLPASVALVCLYIAHMASSNVLPKPSSLATTLSALSYFHKITGFPDPTSNFLIRKLLQGLSKSNPSSDNRLPITLPILHKLISISDKISTSPYETFLVSAMFSLMFHAFLRIGEVTSSPHNVQFSQLSISNQITLQFNSFIHHMGPPFSLQIPRSQSSPYCLVQLMSY